MIVPWLVVTAVTDILLGKYELIILLLWLGPVPIFCTTIVNVNVPLTPADVGDTSTDK